MNSTLLITFKLANQDAPKALFTEVVWYILTKHVNKWCFFLLILYLLDNHTEDIAQQGKWWGACHFHI